MNKKSQLKSHSLKKHDVRIILTETKLRSQFNIKDDANKEHKHDLVYYSRFPSTNCTDSNIEETVRRLGERVMDQAVRDTKSQIVMQQLIMRQLTLNI